MYMLYYNTLLVLKKSGKVIIQKRYTYNKWWEGYAVVYYNGMH